MFAFALINEYIEIFCAEYSFSCDKCGDDLAKSYSQYKPNSNTTKQESIYNIQQLTNTIYNNVCWRKFLIMSLIITLLIAIYKNNLSAIDILMITMIIFIILVSISNFYKYHYISFFKQNIDENLKILS